MFRQFLTAASIPAAATVAPAGVLLLIAYVLRPQWGRLRPNPLPVRDVVDRLWRERKANPSWYAVNPHPAWTVPTTRKRVSACADCIPAGP